MKRVKNWTARKKIIAYLIYSMLLSGLAGCANTSVYVLDEAELIRVKTGQNITAKYDGWLFSDRAVDRVMDAKINKVKLK